MTNDGLGVGDAMTFGCELSMQDAARLVSQQRFAILVGQIAFLLPIALYGFGYFGACNFDSISHYFYAPVLGTLFIVSLSAIGVFLLLYQSDYGPETWLANVAALFVAVLVFMPTDHKGCETKQAVEARIFAIAFDASDLKPGTPQAFKISPFDEMPKGGSGIDYFSLTSISGDIHVIAAGLFLGTLALFCFWIFPRVIDSIHRDEQGRVRPQKKIRNRIYIASGVVMVLSLGAIGLQFFVFNSEAETIRWNAGNWTFILEAVALWAFAVSWMLKGRMGPFAALMDPRDDMARVQISNLGDG